MNSLSFRNVGLALLLAVALAVGIDSGNSLRYSDEGDYAQLTRSLIHDHIFALADGAPTAYRPPGYPAVIVPAYLIAERPIAAKIENAILLLLAAITLGVVARRIHPNAGSITPFLVLGYPLLLYAASVLYPQVLGCLLLTTTIMLLFADQLPARHAVVAGLCYGVLILAIPYFIFLLPVIGAIGFFRRDLRWLDKIHKLLLLGTAALLVVIPWTMRNYLEFHALIPVSANGGWNLFIGNSPETTPNGSVVSVDVISLCKRVRTEMNGNELDAALGKCAVDWIRENPEKAAKLYVRKVINYFNFRNELATKNATTAWGDWLLFATYYPLLLITVVRAALFKRFPFSRAEAVIYILYAANAFISAIFFTRIRFRIPFDFLLLAVAAAFLFKCWDARRRNGASAVESAPSARLS
jgi:hypothetical protein